MTENVRLGHMTELEVIDITDQGAFVNAFDFGELFIPRSQLPHNLQIGDSLRVFLYVDGSRVLATAKRPYLELGMTGKLKVTSIDCGTVYLDSGIPKELVVPVSEQRGSFEVGRDALIYVAIDSKGRLFGTQKFNNYIEDKIPDDLNYTKGQKVKVVPVSHTPLGFRVIVDDKFYGLIYRDQIHGQIVIGKRYDGFIFNVRDDRRVDITLSQMGREGIEAASFQILKMMYLNNGQLEITDKSSPDVIEDYLKMSKGKFKKSIGNLYKMRFISIGDDMLKITDEGILYIKDSLKIKD